MMISGQVLKETEQRFAERKSAREANEEKIRSKQILQADTPERVSKRFGHLQMNEGAVKAITDSGLSFAAIAAPGAVARATLYFLLRYPGKIDDTEKELTRDRLQYLLGWHENHPVSDYEKHRNMAIFEKQGNRNPLIDFPELAEKIDFTLGFGS